MSADLAGAILDFGYLMALWSPGILLARAIGHKNTWLSLTLGFLFSTVVIIVLFHLTALFLATESWWLTSKIVLLVILGVTTWIAVRKRDFASLNPLAIALAIATVAVIARNVFRIDGRLRGWDHFLVGWISSLAQSGHDPTHFGGSEYIKRGFAVPLLLAQGREGQLLLSVTIVILLLALISTFLLATSIGTQWNAIGISLGIGLVILWFTTSLVWGMAFFLNGHALMALAVATLAAQIIGKDTSLTRTPLELITIFVAGFTIASTRPEGVALALILTFPIFVRPALETGRRAAGRLVAILGAPLGFVTWFVTTSFFSFSALVTVTISVIVLLAVIAVFLTVYAKPSWHHTIALIAGVVLVVVALLQLVRVPPRLGTLTIFFSNSFLGTGLWGILPWLFVGIFILHALIRTDKRVTNLVTLTGFAVLFTIAVKIVDGLVVTGGISGLSLGWFDSVNRSFFHLIALPSALFLRLGAITTRANRTEVQNKATGRLRR
jgi:hypothetical protein